MALSPEYVCSLSHQRCGARSVSHTWAIGALAVTVWLNSKPAALDWVTSAGAAAPSASNGAASKAKRNIRTSPIGEGRSYPAGSAPVIPRSSPGPTLQAYVLLRKQEPRNAGGSACD